jgi:hypothetical protein
VVGGLQYNTQPAEWCACSHRCVRTGMRGLSGAVFLISASVD